MLETKLKCGFVIIYEFTSINGSEERQTYHDEISRLTDTWPSPFVGGYRLATFGCVDNNFGYIVFSSLKSSREEFVN